LWAPADFEAISEGLMGDPLLIGLFLYGSYLAGVSHGCSGAAGNKKTPQPAGSSRGLRVTVRYQ
jgi:hypothetical protein